MKRRTSGLIRAGKLKGPSCVILLLIASLACLASLPCFWGLRLSTLCLSKLCLPKLWAELRSNLRGDPLIFKLCGPNDGEPINGRAAPNDGEPINGRMLKLVTNYDEKGSISVYVNHVFFYSRSLYLNARRDDATGVLTSDIDFDIERAQRLSGDAPTISVTVYLYSDLTSRLVAYQEWEGNLGRPWIEFLSKSAGNQGNPGAPLNSPGGGMQSPHAPAGVTAMAVHPLQDDFYFNLLASTRKDLLFLSPDDPQLFRGARVVGSGSCFPYGAENREKNVVYLDTSLESSGSQVYVVLWTFDSLGGWKRSEIQLVPRTP